MIRHPASGASGTDEVRWYILDTPAQLARFCEIMHLMDERYAALDVPSLQSWYQRKAKRRRTAVIYGWGDPAHADDPSSLQQVLAFSYKTAEESASGPVENLSIEMIGIAIDLLREQEFHDSHVVCWFQRIVQQTLALTGFDQPLVAMRPKSMTFHAVQRVHDCVAEGVPVSTGKPSGGHIKFVIDQEQDRGDALFWHLRVVTCDDQGTS